jgi:hypothetical protein
MNRSTRSLIVIFTAALALTAGACRQGDARNSAPKTATPAPKTATSAPKTATPATKTAATALPGGSSPRSNVRRYRMKRQKLTDAKLISWIASKTDSGGLCTIDLRENQITHKGVEALAQAKICQVTGLTLDHNTIGDAGARAIAAGPRFTMTNFLYLKKTGITAVGMRALFDGKTRFQHLWELEASDNKLGDDGVAAIAASACFKSATGLYLSNVGMTDKGAKALAASPHLRKLRTLNVDGNKLTAAGVTALKKSPNLAKCTVTVKPD